MAKLGITNPIRSRRRVRQPRHGACQPNVQDASGQRRSMESSATREPTVCCRPYRRSGGAGTNGGAGEPLRSGLATSATRQFAPRVLDRLERQDHFCQRFRTADVHAGNGVVLRCRANEPGADVDTLRRHYLGVQPAGTRPSRPPIDFRPSPALALTGTTKGMARQPPAAKNRLRTRPHRNRRIRLGIPRPSPPPPAHPTNANPNAQYKLTRQLLTRPGGCNKVPVPLQPVS